MLGKNEEQMQNLPNKILIFLVYTVIILFAGWNIRKRFEPKPQIISESNSQEQKLKAHVTGTSKKKVDPKTGVIEETTNFNYDIESFLASQQNKKAVLAPPILPDNIKGNLNSKLQIGVEFMAFDHQWIGYTRDLKTNENIYQYSYSTRIF